MYSWSKMCQCVLEGLTFDGIHIDCCQPRNASALDPWTKLENHIVQLAENVAVSLFEIQPVFSEIILYCALDKTNSLHSKWRWKRKCCLPRRYQARYKWHRPIEPVCIQHLLLFRLSNKRHQRNALNLFASMALVTSYTINQLITIR